VPAEELTEGTVLAGRFSLEGLAGRGGMGSIYRARDAHSGQVIALKLLHGTAGEDALRRFTREAEVLAELRHPGVVAHVAHGVTEHGNPFLAMEWLEGEDLAHRLAREPLSLEETLALLRRVAEALATAHHKGIIHRDLKPGNLFLRHGRPEDAVVLDFGLARRTLASQVLTNSQMVLGTPRYMAPEQASHQGDITPGADIFSLGCVLYECLTGQPPFTGQHFTAVLAKILFAEPAPLRTVRPGLPGFWQHLVERMLAKNPRQRPPDAMHLLALLSALERLPEGAPVPMKGRDFLESSNTEQQLVSVLLATPPASTADESTVDLALGDTWGGAWSRVLEPFGVRGTLLAGGSLVATLLPSQGTATDQAALAARCALSLKERWPESTIVVATGRCTLGESLPMGESMDRAGWLLRQRDTLPEAGAAPVLLDELTAGLLGPGFQLTRLRPELFLLQGERLRVDESRLLLGRPTSCVGREQELSLLKLAFTSCVEEPCARAVLVVAPPGTGKSRLRHEFLRRLEQQGQECLLLLGRGEPMSAGSTCGLLGQALRRLCGVVDGEDLASRRERLTRRLALHLPPSQAQEVVEFLGELCAIPFPDEGRPRLRAARGDPHIMSAQLGRALVTFLQAECARQPVLLLLEDLHWGDLLTVKLVDGALRELAESPFMVLAMARPEVKELFPKLWARCLQELSLRGLARRASVQLVREVLGARVDEATLESIVEQSAGNALFLEELIRRVAEGRGDAPPETVLAMLQARLLRLEPGARRVLLAASILGQTFWSGGVQVLRGQEDSGEEVEQRLRELVELELIEPRLSHRFPLEVEYRFRHALVRDAAYGLMPETVRVGGHRLAGAWLERVGETDPLVLAEHFHRGHQPERALRFYTLAAEQLFRRYDMPGTLRCLGAAMACGPGPEVLVQLRTLQARADLWVDNFSRAYELGRMALRELKAGGRAWCELAGALLMVSAHSGKLEYMLELGQTLLHTDPDPEAITAYVEAVGFSVFTALWAGQSQPAALFLRRMEQVGAEAAASDAIVRGWLQTVKGVFLHFLGNTPWQAALHTRQGHQAFLEIGEERNDVAAQNALAMVLASLGDLPGAVMELEGVDARAQRLGEQFLIALCGLHVFLTLADSSEASHWRQARARAQSFMGTESRNILHVGIAHAVLAKVAVHFGDWHEAEAQAMHACAILLHLSPPFLLLARLALGAALLGQGRSAEARQVVELGMEGLEQLGGAGCFAVRAHLALAEVCFAQSDTVPGEASLRQALRTLRTRAGDIPEPTARERFLRQVPENARVLELAHQRWGEAPEG
jgi:serine/threonine protein kinase